MSLPPPLPPTPAAQRLRDVLRTRGREARYFDGDTPVPQTAQLGLDVGAQVLEITLQGAVGPRVRWPLDQIRQLEDTAGSSDAVLRWQGDPLARLYVQDAGLLKHMPRLHYRSPPKGRVRLGAWAIGAVAAVALQIGVLVPLLADRLATFVPPAGERALGEATFGQIRSALAGAGLPPLPTCDGAQGLASLDKMRGALGADADAVRLFVLDHEMVNAFALPGGYVVFFRGMIDAAQSPNEIAAVLAHEIGHVENRDPTRHALRSAGSIGILGLLFGDFAGGAAVLFMAEQLISASYSQGAETGADTYAFDALEAANVSPAALGDMFARLRDEYGDAEGIEAHFISHPTLGSRIARAHIAAREGVTYGDIISADDWAALKAVCD